MPRDLADVLHYFLPELGESQDPSPSPPPAPSVPPATPDSQTSSDSALALPLIAVPISDRDLVRAALTWNLAIEISRLGGRALVVAPASLTPTPLWPEAGVGPLGCELIRPRVSSLDALTIEATRIAIDRHVGAGRGGAVFVRVPPEWIRPSDVPARLRWWLLMTSSHRRHLDEALVTAEQIQATIPHAAIGATIHGVETIAEAKRAYGYLARRCENELSIELTSYGLLVDDLDVYRAIAAQRPVGLSHPQAPATRALGDVAQLLYNDARSRSLG